LEVNTSQRGTKLEINNSEVIIDGYNAQIAKI
jgi:hypothetical protein